MRQTFLFALMLFGSVTVGFLACHRNDAATPAMGSLVLTFDNVVGNQDLALNTGTYQNTAGEQFTVSRLNYFVSNIRLKRTDGSDYVVPQDSSYFLVQEADPASQVVTVRNVPVGDYTGITYLIGVDSLRSTMDISRRKGVLEPAGGHNAGMYWDWNSGYIFFKLEGTSPQAPADPSGSRIFQYHIGLFGGYDTKTLNNLRTATVPFTNNVVAIQAGQTTPVAIKADILRVFDGATRVSIAQNPLAMVSPFSATIANNYTQMFQYVAQQPK
ncbi:MbnP family protein [Spirosoma fluminis]